MSYQLISAPNAITKFQGKPDGAEDLSVSGLALAPHNLGALNVCDFAGNCARFCVGCNTGRNRFSNTRKAQLRRKKLLFENPKQFRKILRSDLERFLTWSSKKNLQAFFRPHLYSDTPKNPNKNDITKTLDYRWLAREYPDCQFYTYTKNPFLYRWQNPKNYAITFSRSEKTHYQTALAYLNRGYNVSIVFDTHYNGQRKEYGALPKTWLIGGKRFNVVDGDKHDYRHPIFDGRSNIVGLRFKGSKIDKANAIKTGFCLEVN